MFMAATFGLKGNMELVVIVETPVSPTIILVPCHCHVKKKRRKEEIYSLFVFEVNYCKVQMMNLKI